MSPCADCGRPCAAACRLCDECIARRVLAEREAQGLPPRITDPAVLDRLDRLTRVAVEPERESEAS
jgi:hypothetical protein